DDLLCGSPQTARRPYAVITVANENHILRRNSYGLSRPFRVTARHIHKDSVQFLRVTSESPKYSVGIYVTALDEIPFRTNRASDGFAAAGVTAVINNNVADHFRRHLQSNREIVQPCLFVFPADAAVFVEDAMG